MPISSEPVVTPVKIADLRPTQITVGMREVAARRAHWRRRSDLGQALGRHMIPAVIGPKERPYIVDHHHLVLALHDEGIEEVLIAVVRDLGHLDKVGFWRVLDNHGWMHPFDENGERCSYRDIPTSISGLVDDPYRSLSGALRRAGGYAKDTTPFSEFLWADFLRRRIKRSLVAKDFDRAVALALEHARNREADYLPGWCGPVGD